MTEPASVALGAILTVLAAVIIVGIMAVVGLIASSDSRTDVQYVTVEYVNSNGDPDRIEGWVEGFYYPRGSTIALDWYGNEERTEISTEALVEVERGDWVKTDEDDKVPY